MLYLKADGERYTVGAGYHQSKTFGNISFTEYIDYGLIIVFDSVQKILEIDYAYIDSYDCIYSQQ
jgi:hypothetical protein